MKRVLIVEDDRNIVELVRYNLHGQSAPFDPNRAVLLMHSPNRCRLGALKTFSWVRPF
jgi:hypothetical protein